MKLLLTILLILVSIFVQGQDKEPRQIAAKITQVTKVKGKRVECKAVTMQNEEIIISKCFNGWMGKKKMLRRLSPGVWITIYSKYKSRYSDWIVSEIKISG